MGKLRAINTPHPLAVVDWQETEIDRSSSPSETTDKTQHLILHSGTREMGRELGHKLHHVVYSTLWRLCLFICQCASISTCVPVCACVRACGLVRARLCCLNKPMSK